jgi:DNA polymerase (family 10)
MDQRTASDVLARLAFALEVEGSAPHEARAFATAARMLRQVTGDLRAQLESGALAEVRGIGKSSLRVIATVLEGKEPDELRELEAKIPEGLFAIHGIKGLGPAKIRKLWQGLGITTIGELEHACRENRLITLEGFGKKTQENVLREIESLRRAETVLLRSRAAALVLPLIASLRARGVRAVALGDFARGMELVDGLAIAVCGDASEIDATLAAHGASEGRIDGTTLDVARADESRFGVVCVARTSSAEHLELLRAAAAKRGLLLEGDALRDGAGEVVRCADDDALYEALGLCTTPPERREPGVPLIVRGKAQPRLIELEDLRGALHNHTVASDGSATLDEMRAAAAAMGLSYLGISDHSVSAHYARGLSADALRAQAARIAELTPNGCTILSGVESDIRADGALDYEPEVLAVLDVVIASVHRRHGLDRAASTERMVLAARNPFTDVIGHPTGRLLLGRPPNDFDMDAMLDAAAESGCAVELNSSPHRLDLEARHVAMAKERGVLVSIAADAHATGELRYLEHGIAVGRRGGLTAEDVLNARSLDELRAWLAARRARATARPSA